MNLVEHFKNARNAVSVPAGRMIFRAGERGTVMYVLMSGSAGVVVGQELVEIARPGAILGEMALLDGTVRSATVVARGDCQLVPVPREQFALLITEEPQFAHEVMKSMARRLRSMNERAEEALPLAA